MDEITGEALDSLLVLEADRLGDVRGEARMGPGDEHCLGEGAGQGRPNRVSVHIDPRGLPVKLETTRKEQRALDPDAQSAGGCEQS